MTNDRSLHSYDPARDAQLVTVIITDNLLRGDGTEENPLRRIRQVWTVEGELIAERDPNKG